VGPVPVRKQARKLFRFEAAHQFGFRQNTISGRLFRGIRIGLFRKLQRGHLPLPTGIFNIGGQMTTAGDLVFTGATADDYLRALDENSGKVLWSDRLPAGGNASPMSYAVNGKQYVVIAAGGHGGLGTKTGDYVTACSLQ
jgi:glucose dehydrogenase